MPEQFTEGTPPAGVGPAASSGSPSTGPAAVAVPRVTALVLVHNGSAWLASCLDAVARQTLTPDRVVIVDVASTDTSAAIAKAHGRLRAAVPDTSLLTLERELPLARVLDRAIAHVTSHPVGGTDGPASPGTDAGTHADTDGTAPGGGAAVAEAGPETASATEWVWVVHDDSAPQPEALRLLLEAARKSPSVGVAGPKLVEWGDPRRLVGLGIQVTRTGRSLPSPQRGEADQGQHDTREDVLAVSTSGMLLRRDVHAALGGFDRGFDDVGTDLDFGWRAQLAGHRVIVVPAARVLEASASTEGERPGARRPADQRRTARVAARSVALARCAPLTTPLLALWIAVSSVVAAAGLLVLKRPRQAARELADVLALAHPFAIISARWRGRRTVRLRRAHISSLFVGPGTAARAAADAVQDAVAPERARSVREASPTTETGPSAEESESLGALPMSLARRVLTHPGFLAVTATLVATGVAWRSSIAADALSPTRTGIAGGELRPVTSDASGLWHAFRDAWHGAGLGSGGESSPYLAVLAALTWLAERLPGVSDGRSAAGVTIAWLMFLAPAASAWAAYLAGRVVTRSRAVRAVVAVLWGTSAVVTSGMLEGRLTAVAAHVVLPFVIAGHALAARRDGTYTSAFATALAAAVLGALAPPLLAVSTVAALFLLVLGPGARRPRALVIGLVPIGLLGPWLTVVLDDWRQVLSGPGLVTTASPPDPWRLLLGLPDAGAHGVWPFVLAPTLLLGVVGFAARARSRSGAIGLAVAGLVGLVGLAGAVAAGRVALGSAETGPGTAAVAHLWPGVLLDLWVAGVLVGVLVGGTALVRIVREAERGWRTTAAVLVLAPVAAGAVAQAVALGRQDVSSRLTVEEATRPAVAVEQSGDPLSNRLLVLRPGDGVVDYALVGREPGQALRDLDQRREPGSDPVEPLVADLAGGELGAPFEGATLARHGIGFVQLQAPAGSPLVNRLDAAKGLSRLGTNEHGTLWKVLSLPSAAPAPAPSRLRLTDAAGRMLAVVPTDGPHGATDTSLAPGPSGRRLVVAEPHEWAEHVGVTFDGRTLPTAEGVDQPTFVLPPTAGVLRIDLEPARPWWRLAQVALLAVALFMALPFGNRRSRRSTR